MSLLVAWLAYPLLLAALALGCGLLLERLSGIRLPGPLLVAAGLAVVVVATDIVATADATAEAGPPVAGALAAIGLLVGRPRRPEAWPAVAALAAFASFAAPIVLSGSATFAGYIKLDDTATFLALTDRVMDHGRSLAGLAPSSYETALAVNLGRGYPVGSLLPLGAGAKLTGVDPAWLFQPYLAFLGAALALALYALLEPLATARPLRAAAAFVGAQPALLYAYSLWGGIKELAAAALLALVAALVPPFLRRPSPRRAFPLAVAAAAVLSVLSAAGAVWLLPALVVLLVRTRPAAVATVVAGALALAVPALLGASDFLRRANTESFTSGSELGNLIQPLGFLQAFGVWPAGDFRLDPQRGAQTHVLIALVIAAALLGLWWAARRRAWGLLVYVGCGALGSAVFFGAGSPWVGAKAIAMASPAFVAAAAAGIGWAFQAGRRTEAAVALAAVAGGVLWSNGLAYREANLAPRAQLRELERIGERFAGAGPALMTEYQVYGVRHFLRRLDAEGASELRRRLVPLRSGALLDKGTSADIDEIRLDAVLVYRTLVLRRSPAGSRPPSPYRLVWRGRWYDVWQRPETSRRAVVEHLSLGGAEQAGAVPACDDVVRAGRSAGKRGRVAAVRRAPAIVARLDGDVVVPRGGRYRVWLGGSFRGSLELLIDGRVVESAHHQLNWPGNFTPFASVSLAPGRHRVEVRSGGAGWRPGSGGPSWPLGPLVLTSDSSARPVAEAPAADARGFCGKRLDWVEALAPPQA